MTAGWTGSDMAAGDVAWRALRRLGLDPFEAALLDRDAPPFFVELDQAITPVIDRIVRDVLDELEVRLYGEARERVVASVRSRLVAGAQWDVVEAVRGELMRPEPEPYAPPPAGSWVRTRYLPRGPRGRLGARPEPRWAGSWHMFSGDLVANHRPSPFLNDRDGRSRCGLRVTLRSAYQDSVVADAMPGVDVCGRCRRSAA